MIQADQHTNNRKCTPKRNPLWFIPLLCSESFKKPISFFLSFYLLLDLIWFLTRKHKRVWRKKSQQMKRKEMSDHRQRENQTVFDCVINLFCSLFRHCIVLFWYLFEFEMNKYNQDQCKDDVSKEKKREREERMGELWRKLISIHFSWCMI